MTIVGALAAAFVGLLIGGWIEHCAGVPRFGPVSFPLAFLCGALVVARSLHADRHARSASSAEPDTQSGSWLEGPAIRDALETGFVLAVIALIIWLASVFVVKHARADIRPSRGTLIITCESQSSDSIAMKVIR